MHPTNTLLPGGLRQSHFRRQRTLSRTEEVSRAGICRRCWQRAHPGQQSAASRLLSSVGKHTPRQMPPIPERGFDGDAAGVPGTHSVDVPCTESDVGHPCVVNPGEALPTVRWSLGHKGPDYRPTCRRSHCHRAHIATESERPEPC